MALGKSGGCFPRTKKLPIFFSDVLDKGKMPPFSAGPGRPDERQRMRRAALELVVESWRNAESRMPHRRLGIGFPAAENGDQRRKILRIHPQPQPPRRRWGKNLRRPGKRVRQAQWRMETGLFRVHGLWTSRWFFCLRSCPRPQRRRRLRSGGSSRR